jgi:hypothetical protein
LIIIIEIVKVGIKNSTGQPYKGHTSIWVTNCLQELHVYLEEVLINVILITGWVNGNLYMATNETLGILPIPGDIRDSSRMALFIDIADSTQKPQKHKFLAEMQGTCKAILPIHTSSEKGLFRTLMENDRHFNPPDGSLPNWNQATRVWNAWADRTDDVWYKVCIFPSLKVFLYSTLLLLAQRPTQSVPLAVAEELRHQGGPLHLLQYSKTTRKPYP